MRRIPDGRDASSEAALIRLGYSHELVRLSQSVMHFTDTELLNLNCCRSSWIRGGRVQERGRRRSKEVSERRRIYLLVNINQDSRLRICGAQSLLLRCRWFTPVRRVMCKWVMPSSIAT